MEIFGSGFDDSMFVETRHRVSTTTLLNYNAKFCEPEWFCDASALDTDDSLEKQKIFKFRGDLAFRQGCYQKSLDAYSGCLEWLPDNNLTIRRDILEGMARCYTHLGHKDKALEMTDLLSKDSSNTCHLTCLLLLKVSIHQHFGALGSKISSLQDLCSLLHFNPWYWYDLGLTCLDLLEADKLQAPGFCSLQCDSTGLQPGRRREAEKDVDREDRSKEEETDIVWLKACMCLIRTRLLFKILRQQQSSFVLQRSENTFQRTEELLQKLNPKEGTRQTLTEVMSEDLIPEKMREENQDGESLAGLCMQSFKDRWWNKILLTGILQTDGPSHYRKIQTNTQQNVTD